MIIDSHTHLRSQKDLVKLLFSMKNNKIEKSIIIHNPKEIDSFSSLTINELVNVANNHKNLFIVGSVKIAGNKNIKEEIQEMDALAKKRKIIGMKVYLGYEPIFANDKKIEPIAKLCLKYNIPLIFHTGDTYNLAGAMIRCANPIYIDDVAIKFPKLKIVIAHCGNPWTKEAALVISKNKNVYADISGLLSYGGKYQKQDNINVRAKLMELIAWCDGADKLLFGTDYPIYGQEQYIKFLKELKLSKNEFELIKYKNAKKLFGI